jgi:hypothetical protein
MPFREMLQVLMWAMAAVAALDALVLLGLVFFDRTVRARQLHLFGVVCALALSGGAFMTAQVLPRTEESWGLFALLAAMLGSQWLLVKGLGWLDARAVAVD